MKFQVKAQSNDAIVMTVEADDIYEAVDKISERYPDSDISIRTGGSRIPAYFEDDMDYYDVYDVSDE